MNIYVYSDESGVFDYKNNEYFVFAGLIFLSDKDRQEIIRRFDKLEKSIRSNFNISKSKELKACKLRNKDKRRLFNILNNTIKFGVVIKQEKILKHIFDNKKSKQRYLDYAYKIGLKYALENLIRTRQIDVFSTDYLIVNCDEHTTATNGKYELKESLLNEFKIGTFNSNYQIFFEPIFKNLKDVTVSYSNSEHSTLIRAADIVANRIYNIYVKDEFSKINNIQNLYIKELP